MAELTKTQLKVLSDAVQHENGAAAVPNKMGSTAARKLSELLVERKLMREVLTKPGMPIWRKGDDDRATSLVILRAGRDLILEHGDALPSDKRISLVNPSDSKPKGHLLPTTSPAQPRAGSKLALVIAMLSNEAGASLKSLAEMAGWLPHTTRATLTGLRKRGFLIERVKDDDLGTIYRIAGGSKTPVPA
jgi:hypothetical protein